LYSFLKLKFIIGVRCFKSKPIGRPGIHVLSVSASPAVVRGTHRQGERPVSLQMISRALIVSETCGNLVSLQLFPIVKGTICASTSLIGFVGTCCIVTASCTGSVLGRDRIGLNLTPVGSQLILFPVSCVELVAWPGRSIH
jgi:hypothetical protein